MANPLAWKCITVSPSNSSAQNLLTILQAVDTTVGAFMAAASQVLLQADPGNSTNNVWVGDDALSSTRIGYVLTATSPGFPLPLRSHRMAGDIPLGEIFVMASGGTPKLNVIIIP